MHLENTKVEYIDFSWAGGSQTKKGWKPLLKISVEVG